MSALLDFLPLIAFFVAYKWGDIYLATSVLIGVTVAQTAWTWFSKRQVPKLALVTCGLVLAFGLLTLALHDERWIKWKVSVVYGLFAIAFLGSNWIGAKPLWQRALEEQVEASREVWVRANTAWALFFVVLAVANAWVLTNFDTATWVNFKVWGVLGALVLFTLAQVLYLTQRGRFKDAG
jgi:intracellular septation protein